MNPSEIQVLDNLAPPALHRSMWAVFTTANWRFGNRSGSGDENAVPFWRMDLDRSEEATEVWAHARERCESRAGQPLEVHEQYANGHTYGLGGRAHRDTLSAGRYTLLYYPVPAWEDVWDGETVFFNEDREIAAAIKPMPNRGVFFDSRLLHVGRAPSRQFAGLRVTVAFKLRVIEAGGEAA